LSLAGLSEEEIQEVMRKPDGGSLSITAVRYTVKICKENGGMSWDGVLENRAGRPKETTPPRERTEDERRSAAINDIEAVAGVQPATELTFVNRVF